MWHGIELSGFSTRIIRERRIKPPDPDFTGGALAPIWSYGEALALASSHPQMVTQVPLRF
jgi:hypothetical protein